jgi:hypothetical protein
MEAKSHRYSLDRRVSGPQSRSGRCGEGTNLYECRESNPGRPDTELDSDIKKIE